MRVIFYKMIKLYLSFHNVHLCPKNLQNCAFNNYKALNAKLCLVHSCSKIRMTILASS